MSSLPPPPRKVIHLDADAFFASVEQASDPRLRGKAIAVGGEKRGIIASASYEARKAGVYTPMPTARARKICPKLIVLPGDFAKYEQFSQWMFSYIYDFTPEVEISSIDEGYYDVSGQRKSPLEIADIIRRAIHDSLKITVSKGMGTNKLISQIAAKLNKPAAFHQVHPGQEQSFLQPLPHHWLPGIGPKTALRLRSAGLATIGQVAEMPVDMLALMLGRQAGEVHEYSLGHDDRPVVALNAPAKSYSQQETFDADTTDEAYVAAVLRRMADQLMATVRTDGKCVRTLTVKVRYNDMAEDQRAESLLEPTDLETDIYGRLDRLLQEAWKRRVSLRLVSLKLSNVYGHVGLSELDLGAAGGQTEARRRLTDAVDRLRQEMGPKTILRGHDFVLNGKMASCAEAAAARLPAPRVIVPKIFKYVPLQVQSYYSFLDSTLSPQAIVELAVRHNLPSVALTDFENLHGAVAFSEAAREAGIQGILGASVGWGKSRVHLYVQDQGGYRNLCHILSLVGRPAERSKEGENLWSNAHEHKGLLLGREQRLREALRKTNAGLIATAPPSLQREVAPFFEGRFYVEASSDADLARSEYPAVASVPVCYGGKEDHWKYQVVQSIRTLTLLDQKHPAKRLETGYHFRNIAEMNTLFSKAPRLLENSIELARRCKFSLPLGQPQFPAYQPADGSTPAVALSRLVHTGLQTRYGTRATQFRRQAEEELAIIHEVGYEEYFLAVWAILQDCRKEGIDWITRGSAADSLVCYCLGISGVCPIRFDLYFRRFLNKDRMLLNKLPDIDIDFPHDRKDDVVDLIFARYGLDHTAIVGGFSTYQSRSALGDVAKVLGVSEYHIRRFTEHLPRTRPSDLAVVLAENQECRDLPVAEEPYASAIRMAEFLDGFPRHPKMHPCGLVIGRNPIRDLTPTFQSNKGYPTTHFDMEAVEAVGLIKMDILAQGGLAVMRDMKASLGKRGITFDLDALEPWQDDKVWKMIASGGARAVHHIESPAMVSLCRQCNVRDIDGLVAIVSVIRPGAANEHKKTSFTRRYQGMEPVDYLHPSLEPCLKSTFGMVVYEEHILQICEAFAGLNGGRADVLRRALGKNKEKTIAEIRTEFVTNARKRGRSDPDIARVWEMVASFRGYAFCKAHSAAYGVEAYQSAWLKRYHPAEFMAAVLSNGKGFYQPLVYVLECHRLRIPLRLPCVNIPGPKFEAGHDDSGPFIRVPALRVKGLTERTRQRWLVERQRNSFTSLANFYQRVQPAIEEIEQLLRVGVFDTFGQSRARQFWEIQFLRQSLPSKDHPNQLSLLPPDGMSATPATTLIEPDLVERLKAETELFEFPVSAHPLAMYPEIAWKTYCPIDRLAEHVGERVVVCGLVIEDRIHHQVTGEAMKFMTITDWTGMIETELFAQTYRNYGLATIRHPVLEIEATVEPYENGRGHTLRVWRAGQPRTAVAI